MRRVALIALLLGALVAPAGATAASCPQTSLADIEDEVMCPVCGTPLALVDEAPQAERQRALIRRLIERCESKGEVKAALVAEFGQSVLALPEGEGFALAAYVVPLIAIVLGATIVIVAALRWRRRRRRCTPPDEGDWDEGGEGSAGVREPRRPSPGGLGAAAAARLESDIDRYDL